MTVVPGPTAEAAFDLLCSRHTFVVLDVETCPAPDGDHIISIAAATCRLGKVRSIWSTNVDPGVPITNSWVHGMTDTDVVGAPTMAEVLEPLDKLLAGQDTVLVCHNAKFDVGRLHLEVSRLSGAEALRDVPVIDTMRLPDAAGLVMPSRTRSLAAVCGVLGVANQAAHTAVGDATATADCLHGTLRTAAANGLVDLMALHADAGGLTTSTITASGADATIVRRRAAELPTTHLATHTSVLSNRASARQLDVWAAGALECAQLRCHLLADKAGLATHHAIGLHERLSDQLLANAGTFEPGQGGTLVAALNVLATDALRTRPGAQTATRWWRKHGSSIGQLAPCGPEAGECPDCAAGWPCPIDIAHQPVATTMLFGTTDKLSVERRKKISGADESSFVVKWSRLGLHTMAGYAAWLAVESWLAEGHPGRATGVVDQALQYRAFDPRVLRLYAERLTLQNRHDDAAKFVKEHLQNRTTDPGWQELADWWDRYLARRTAKPARATAPSTTSSRARRPADRVRPRRFTTQPSPTPAQER